MRLANGSRQKPIRTVLRVLAVRRDQVPHRPHSTAASAGSRRDVGPGRPVVDNRVSSEARAWQEPQETAHLATGELAVPRDRLPLRTPRGVSTKEKPSAAFLCAGELPLTSRHRSGSARRVLAYKRAVERRGGGVRTLGPGEPDQRSSRPVRLGLEARLTRPRDRGGVREPQPGRSWIDRCGPEANLIAGALLARPAKRGHEERHGASVRWSGVAGATDTSRMFLR